MSLKESWQLAKQQRQQAVIERQQTVQHLLSDMKQVRQLKAVALQSDLDTFVQTLKHQTAEFLSNTVAERVLVAQQVEVLRSDVQSYLYELDTQQQQRAEQLWQDLQASRTEREIEMQQLFNRFLDFRIELQHFHQTLHDYVWGTETSPSTTVEASPISQVETRSNGVTQTSQPLPEPATRNGTKTHHPASSGTPKSSPEKAVYTFLHESQGARLTQIEAALNLNRFQTVDALRSLIKKGLVTQRDRVYLLQESV
jgi:hypothetical protein